MNNRIESRNLPNGVNTTSTKRNEDVMPKQVLYVQAILNLQMIVDLKLLHWQTKSDIIHKAIGTLCDEMYVQIDRMIEGLSGFTGNPVTVTSSINRTLSIQTGVIENDNAVMNYLDEKITDLKNDLKDPKFVAVHNVLQDMMLAFSKAKYSISFK